MSQKVFREIEIVVSMMVGVIIVTYTQDILMSIVYAIPIGIAYPLFSKCLKKRNNHMK